MRARFRPWGTRFDNMPKRYHREEERLAYAQRYLDDGSKE